MSSLIPYSPKSSLHSISCLHLRVISLLPCKHPTTSSRPQYVLPTYRHVQYQNAHPLAGHKRAAPSTGLSPLGDCRRTGPTQRPVTFHARNYVFAQAPMPYDNLLQLLWPHLHHQLLSLKVPPLYGHHFPPPFIHTLLHTPMSPSVRSMGIMLVYIILIHCNLSIPIFK